MPEGHIVHAQARAIARAFAGTRVAVDSPQGRFAAGAAIVDGTVLTGTQAYGKHLYIGFAGGHWIHVHLGLYGKWVIAKGPAPEVRGELRLRMVNDTHHAELRGPAVCELLDDEGMRASIARIGPDPIRRDADPERAWAKVQRSRQPIGALLMDQGVFAGVGNIYRAEVLFRHEVSPFRPSTAVARAEFDAMWADLEVLMRQGVRRRRIDTVRDEHLPKAMGRAPRVDRHGGEVYVYRRAGQTCWVCGDEVAADVMQGRNLYWCPTCQRD